MCAEQWFKDYADAVYSYIFMQVCDRHTAEELTQDTFVKVVEKSYQFDGRSAVKTWIFRIAYTTTLNYFRKKHPLTYYFGKELELFNSHPSSEETTIHNAQQAELYEAIGKLKKSYQQVVLLRHIQGFSSKETAEIMSCSEGKVKMKLKRSLTVLKKELEKGGMSCETLYRR